jgi:hypothetical protein
MPSISRTLQTSNGRKKNHKLKEQKKGGQKPEAILTEEENRVLLKTNPGA